MQKFRKKNSCVNIIHNHSMCTGTTHAASMACLTRIEHFPATNENMTITADWRLFPLKMRSVLSNRHAYFLNAYTESLTWKRFVNETKFNFHVKEWTFVMHAVSSPEITWNQLKEAPLDSKLPIFQGTKPSELKLGDNNAHNFTARQKEERINKLGSFNTTAQSKVRKIEPTSKLLAAIQLT